MRSLSIFLVASGWLNVACIVFLPSSASADRSSSMKVFQSVEKLNDLGDLIEQALAAEGNSEKEEGLLKQIESLLGDTAEAADDLFDNLEEEYGAKASEMFDQIAGQGGLRKEADGSYLEVNRMDGYYFFRFFTEAQPDVLRLFILEQADLKVDPASSHFRRFVARQHVEKARAVAVYIFSINEKGTAELSRQYEYAIPRNPLVWAKERVRAVTTTPQTGDIIQAVRYNWCTNPMTLALIGLTFSLVVSGELILPPEIVAGIGTTITYGFLDKTFTRVQLNEEALHGPLGKMAVRTLVGAPDRYLYFVALTMLNGTPAAQAFYQEFSLANAWFIVTSALLAQPIKHFLYEIPSLNRELRLKSSSAIVTQRNLAHFAAFLVSRFDAILRYAVLANLSIGGIQFEMSAGRIFAVTSLVAAFMFYRNHVRKVRAVLEDKASSGNDADRLLLRKFNLYVDRAAKDTPWHHAYRILKVQIHKWLGRITKKVGCQEHFRTHKNNSL